MVYVNAKGVVTLPFFKVGVPALDLAAMLAVLRGEKPAE